MVIHVTFGSIAYKVLNRLSVQYPLPLYIQLQITIKHLLESLEAQVKPLFQQAKPTAADR